MTKGAFGVVDDADADAGELRAAAAAVGRHNGLLIARVDSPVTASDELLFDVGGAAQRTVISDLSRATSPDVLGDILRRVLRARDRRMFMATATTVYPPPGTSDALVIDALTVGSLIETDTPASPDAAAQAGADPGATGTFPRLLGHYAREQHVLDAKEALRRATTGAAAALDVRLRGIIREGCYADLIVFDPRTIGDASSANAPNPAPAGIEYVVVNGVVVLTPRGLSGARPGYALLHQSSRR
jgi:N-acyl-D-aspartate/D-glutamate deacylase